jgi:hypothetical protein
MSGCAPLKCRRAIALYSQANGHYQFNLMLNRPLCWLPRPVIRTSCRNCNIGGSSSQTPAPTSANDGAAFAWSMDDHPVTSRQLEISSCVVALQRSSPRLLAGMQRAELRGGTGRATFVLLRWCKLRRLLDARQAHAARQKTTRRPATLTLLKVLFV